MAKKTAAPPTFAAALEYLAGHQFDVSASREGSSTKAFQVRKYGCAAEIAAAPDGSTLVLARPGWMLAGQISRIVDRGYQKFIRSPQFELPATADQLEAIHQFQEELTQAIGGISLYNQSLGTTSDVYEYDRLRGREQDAEPAGRRPWELTEGH